MSATVADIFRNIMIISASIAWSSSASSPSAAVGATEIAEAEISSRVLYVVVPELRGVLRRVLAQLKAFKAFLSDLEDPILQPATKYMPQGRRRDARATVLARDRGRDLGTRDGLDIDLWGKALASVSGDFGVQRTLLLFAPSSRADCQQTMRKPRMTISRLFYKRLISL